MKIYYYLLACFLIGLSAPLFGQCPPPGFPDAGNSCPQAPILCENLDGYCNEINNNNTPQNFPGCPGWQLNNDEWFAFFAGTDSISILVTPSNCNQGQNMGLQAGIYAGCGPPWNAMDLQCACTQNPFILNSGNFLVGQVYWFVIDGCGGNVCDYAIDVLYGSTVGVAPDPPGPVTGPTPVCQGTSGAYTTPAVPYGTIYTWTLTPSNAGTINGQGNRNITINWSGSYSGPVELCVEVSNLCYENPEVSCYEIEVIPRPTAQISGSGVICAGAPNPPPVELTITFTGEGPWTFVYRRNGVNQPAITTSDNPYILSVNQPGTYTLASVVTPPGNCTGTVSGTAQVTQVTLTSQAAVTNETCGTGNGAVNLTPGGGTPPYMFAWEHGPTSEDLANVNAGTYTVTITDDNGCTLVRTVTVLDNQINIVINANVQPNTTCNGGNGSITTSVTPSGNYNYLWSNNETTPSLTNLSPGTYTLTVTTGVTCTATAEFTIDDNPNEPDISGTPTPSTCDLANGNINISVTGGVTPYTFSWSNNGTSEDLANIPAGSYTVTVTGANGCTDTEEFTVDNNNPPFTVDGNVVANTTCNGGNGSITTTVSPNGNYTYLWNTNATTPNISNLPPDTYTVTVSAGGSCTETVEFVVPDEPLEPNISSTTVSSTCDLPNGSINLSVSGGVAPYTFLWSNNATSQNLANIPAGSYDVTVTGANGCTATETITLDNENPPIDVDANIVSNTTCIGGNGSITLFVSPSGNYTYLWNTNATTPNLTNLPPGDYSVTVSGGGSCSQTADFTVPDEPNTPNINYNTIPSTCELSNGTINLSVSGGVAPYTYQWSNNATSQNLTNVPAGSYDVTVTGANGCTTTETITLDNENPPIFIDGNVLSNTTCIGGNGSITLSISPSGNYTYLWNTNATTPNLTNLPPGDYSVTVSGGGACTETADFNVPDEPNTPNINYNTNPSTCELSNGSITVSASGGVAPYTYQWSNNATTQNLTNVPAGSYDVTVTGANGCTSVENIFLDNENPPISIDANIVSNTTCIGGNGSIQVFVSPSGNYTYLWSNNATTPNLNNLPPGDYFVTVSSGGACTETAAFTVPDEPNTPNINYNTNPSTCELSNGSITVSASGGVAPYTYQWSNNATSQNLTNVPSGSYDVTVTGANGCTTVENIFLDNDNPPISIDANVNPNTACAFGNGSIQLFVSPTNPAYTYLWSNNATTPNLNNLPAGDYTVTVSAGGACVEVATFTVPDDPLFPDLSFSQVDARCGLSNGSINLSVFGGAAPYSYLWSPGNQITQDLNNIPSGFYNVTVTGANGCTNTDGVFISDEEIPISLDGSVNDKTSCITNNGSISLSYSPNNVTFLWSNSSNQPNLNNLAAGTYTVTVSAGGTCTETMEFTVSDISETPNVFAEVTAATCGFNNGIIILDVFDGIPPYTYKWSNNATSQNLNNLAAGNYAVTVTTSVGCTSVLFVNVPGELIDIEITGTVSDNVSCTQPNGYVDIDLFPTAPYTYLWSNNRTTQDIFDVPAGIYTVTVTLGTGCSAEATFEVFDATNPPNLSTSTTPAVCGQPNGSATVNASGGSAPYTYVWTGGGNSATISNRPIGTYTVTVTDFFGCSATASATIVNSTIAVNITGVVTANTSCSTPNGAVDITVTPTATYTYTWSNTAGTQDISGLAPATYTVTASAGVGCTASASFVVPNNTVNPVPSPVVTASICGLSNGAIDLSVSSGTSPYGYLWSNTANSQDLNNILAGVYTVTITDANGCTAVSTSTVPNNASTFSLSGITTALTNCVSANGAIDLTVTPAGAYTYQWSNTATTQDIANLPAGTYTVSVTEQGDCVASATFIVADSLSFPVLNQSITPELCGLIDGAIDLSVSGGASPFTYSWASSQTTEDLSGIPAGDYAVTVTGANGCTGTAAATVPASAINFSIAGTPAANTSCIAGNGAVNISLTPAVPGAGPGYSFLWSNMAATEDLVSLAPGAYTVTVSAGGTCTGTASYNVANNALPPNISENVGAALCGQSSGFVNLTISGGMSPYGFQWSNMATSEDLNGLVSGAYTVTVTGANGCSATETFNVQENTVTPTISGIPTPNTSCVTSNGSINISVSPTTLTYTYAWSGLQTTPNISGLAPGVYTVTVNGGGACTNTATFTVDNNVPAPQVTGAISPALCGQSSGSIDLTTSGGVSPYAFQWSNTGTIEDLGGIPSGTYTVTVTGANGCSNTATYVVPENSLTPMITPSATPVTSCVVPNGAISLSVSPATLNYTYAWSGSQTTPNITDLSAGAYTVTVYGGGACTATATVVVGSNIPAPQVSEVIAAATCGQSSGSINLTTSGGTSPYAFNWSNNTSAEDLANVPSGTYTVTVTGANGCSASTTFAVPESTILPTVAGTITPVSSCVVSNGSISLNVTPVNLPYTYAWSNSFTTATISNLPVGSYTVTVNGGGACISTATFAVNSATGTVVLSGVQTDVLCFGQNTGAINLTVGGGAAPYSFAWSPNLPGNPEDPTNLSAGTYQVTVTDAADCTTTGSFAITQPASALQLACSETNKVTFPGATDGAAALNLTGGTAPYTVTLSPGGTQTNVPTGVLPINNLGQGSYSVTVTDANGCTTTCNFTINIISCDTRVGIMQGNTLSLCGEGCLTANYNSVGEFLEPGDVLQFILHQGSGAQIVNEIARSTDPTFCFNPATMTYGATYYISAAAGNNDGAGNVVLSHFCTVVAPGTPIVFRQKPVADATQPGPLNCAVKQVPIVGSSDIPGSTFAWTTTGGQITGSPSQPNISATAAGQYRLIVTANGCADTVAVQVQDITNQPQATVIADPNSIIDCAISQIILSGDIKGTNDANSVWLYNGNVYAVGTVLNISSPGVYEFVIFDTLTFCSDTALIQIQENLNFPPLFINPPGSLNCINNSVTLSGGSSFPGIQFTWALVNGTDTTIVGSGTSVNVNTPGTYVLMGLDPVSHCTNTIGTQVVGDLVYPTADAGTPFSIYCYGETALLDGTGSSGLPGLIFQWTTSDGGIATGSSTPTPTINRPGTYTLVVTNPGNGCTDSATVVIAPDEPILTALAKHPACEGDRGAIVIDTVIGGEPPLRFSINGGQTFTTSNLIGNLLPGNYTVFMVDANGCSTEVDVTLDSPQVVQITLDAEVSLKLGDTYLIEATVNLPAASLAQIQWTPANGLSCDTCLITEVRPFVSSIYRLTVVSKAGCRDDATLRLLVDRRPNVYIPNVFKPDTDGENAIFRIYADQTVKQVKTFQVFSRWGELVHEYYNFIPDSPAHGWNGTHRGQPLNPAVFAYYAVIELIDGQEVVYSGDVTIAR